jgi:hypothetical protein
MDVVREELLHLLAVDLVEPPTETEHAESVIAMSGSETARAARRTWRAYRPGRIEGMHLLSLSF